MKIGLVARGVYPFDFGGREIRAFQLAKNFSKKHDVTVFVPRGGTDYPKCYENFEIHPIDILIENPRLLNFGGAILFARKVSKILEGGGFDAIDIMFSSFPFKKEGKVVASILAILSMWRNVSIVRKIYALPTIIIQAWLSSVKAHFADHIICMSDSSKRETEKFYGIPPEMITTIKNGVDGALFNPGAESRVREVFEIKDSTFLILYAGRLVGEKGVQDLIDAVRELATNHNVRLMIVGKGSFKNRLQQMAGEETLFIDPQPYERMPEFYQAADLFVLPSYWEVQPLACVEAMATGTPVIATNVGGTTEIVKHKKTGLLVPPRDLEALKESILRFYQNTKLRKKIVKNGLELAKSRRWDKVAEKTLHIYEE